MVRGAAWESVQDGMRDVEWEDAPCCKRETDDVAFTGSDDGWNELKWTTWGGRSASNLDCLWEEDERGGCGDVCGLTMTF
jgi:hypothetical protein